mmetsp:Transcript_55168/g.165300  ORF Transcript_55168/g.165300 Transcript_55168/m.165300 type:complete len:216 (+) Transcript_55168:4832-5479(+)
MGALEGGLAGSGKAGVTHEGLDEVRRRHGRTDEGREHVPVHLGPNLLAQIRPLGVDAPAPHPHHDVPRVRPPGSTERHDTAALRPPHHGHADHLLQYVQRRSSGIGRRPIPIEEEQSEIAAVEECDGGRAARDGGGGGDTSESEKVGADRFQGGDQGGADARRAEDGGRDDDSSRFDGAAAFSLPASRVLAPACRFVRAAPTTHSQHRSNQQRGE